MRGKVPICSCHILCVLLDQVVQQSCEKQKPSQSGSYQYPLWLDMETPDEEATLHVPCSIASSDHAMCEHEFPRTDLLKFHVQFHVSDVL